MFKPPIRMPVLQNGQGAYWANTDGLVSNRQNKSLLLVAAYFEWEDVDGNGPNTFVCGCVQRGTGKVMWQTTTGNWPMAGAVGTLVNVTFGANSPVVVRTTSTLEPFSALGNIPEHAWIAPGEQVQLGDDIGVNGNRITNGVLTFLEPWD